MNGQLTGISIALFCDTVLLCGIMLVLIWRGHVDDEREDEAETPPEDARCGTCRYSILHMDTLCCVRYPPLPTDTDGSRLPPVSTEHWCGEWVPLPSDDAEKERP